MLKLRFFLLLFISWISVACLFSGCMTDYSESAVERARKYALKNLPGLTESQRNFIRFTQPVIYANVVFPRYVHPLNEGGHIEADEVRRFPLAPQHDLMHSCIVWNPPKLDAKVVVVGEAERNMQFWSPYRIIVKRYFPGDTSKQTAISAASSFVLENMPYLSAVDQNRARFNTPDILYTKFEQLPSEIQAAEKELAKATAAENENAENTAPPAKEDGKKYTQISLVWPAEQEGYSIVVTGFSTTGVLSGWKVESGELMATSKLNSARLTAEQIAAIEKTHPEKQDLIFLEEETINRNPYDSISNPNSVTSGSILFQ